MVSNINFQDSDADVEEDNITNNEFMADLNAEYQERALLANQKRFYKRSGRFGSARKPIDKSKEACFTYGKHVTKGKGDKGKSEKGLITESFGWDDESVSLEDEDTTNFKAFMAIAEDDPSVGKTEARSSQRVEISMKKINLENEYLKDEISDLKRLLKRTYSKVTLDQLLFEQVPGNIVKALGGKGRRKENNSSKEVVFTKADESSSERIPRITSDSEADCDTHEPLPALPMLIGAELSGTSNSLVSLSDLTTNLAKLTLNTSMSKKSKKSSDKVPQAYFIKKKTEPMSLAIQTSSPDKKVDSSTKQLLLTLME
ncbi:hypothetical protein Tco_0747057 [Tanacetum coccineum]